MVDETITTTVDSLIELLEDIDRIKLEEAAKKLDLPIDVVQSWTDFLVEEKIIGIEYKFTTPYIYLNKKKQKESLKKDEEETASIDKFKQEFEKKAQEKKISKDKATDLWKNHIVEKLDQKKEFFYQEAKKRGFFNAEELWNEYKNKMMSMYDGHK
ncbi:MAG: hypothetical protein KJ583_06040 [Nanoarchaeota archaeon]|nr:hypothetical protein [Nanoarchaeota archaeon]MBU1270262.1 hypothetical protein [Nanoarchaeota archaeon]MBU1604846.1 hypothetical protein [Nanoarchaeota archaeon]MBU2442484.1 hypothetical protein [Nanoarchaeota archaeon]